MKQQYLIFGIVAIILIFAWMKFKNQKPQADIDTRRPSENIFPTNEVPNDKLIIVEDANDNDIKKIIQEFCNSYNKETYQVIPRLTKLPDNKFAITFSYDIDFEIYCYFINYINYPMGFDRHFKTFGWTTTKSTDNWVTEKIVNKNVMLFISDTDTEYDNVFLTTSDNIGYKLGFAMGEEKKILDRPEKRYIKQSININELKTKEHTDFK